MNIIPLETIVSLAQSLPVSCIYALVNDDTKRFQLYSSTNTTIHLLSLIRRINEDPKEFLLREELAKCKLVILETQQITKDRQLELISEYLDNGYTQYKLYAPIKYSLETLVDEERRMYCLYVVNSKANHRILIGRFRKHKTLRQFIEKHYGTGVRRIVKHHSCG